MTFKLITDSTADLDENWAKDQDVEILGLHITLDGQVYETVGENRLTSDLLLERMKMAVSQPPARSMWANLKKPFAAMQKLEKRSSTWPFLPSCQGPIRALSWRGR